MKRFKVVIHLEGDYPEDGIAPELEAFGLELKDVDALVAAGSPNVLGWCERNQVPARTFVKSGDSATEMIADMLSEADSAIILSGGQFDVGSTGILMVGACLAMRIPMSAKIL